MPHVLDQFRLNGRTALITGGSQGLGLTIAKALAEAGAKVVLVSRSLEKCQNAAGALMSEVDCSAMAMAADVTRADDVERLFHEATEKVGSVDILMNSAGLNVGVIHLHLKGIFNDLVPPNPACEV